VGPSRPVPGTVEPRRGGRHRQRIAPGRGRHAMTAFDTTTTAPAPERPGLRQRLANRGIDGVTLLILPALLFVVSVFIYPFLYGLVLSFSPLEGGGWLAN